MDFADGIRDRAQHKKVIPSGNYITINKNFLKDFLETNNLQLAYVVKSYYSIRDYSFSDEMKELCQYYILDMP